MKFSLRRKTALLIVSIVLLISAVSVLISRRAVTNIVREEYSVRATDLAGTIAATVDTGRVRAVRDAVLEIYSRTDDKISNEAWGTPEFEAYAARYQGVAETEEFLSLQAELRGIQDANHVDCLYLVYPDTALGHSVYLLDAAYEDNCPPGSFDLFYEEDYAISYDAAAERTLYEAKGRRSKKREAALLEKELRPTLDALAAELGGAIDWERPLRDARVG